MIDLKQHIRGVPDFPKQGILFYDIGTLLAHGPAWREAVDRMAATLAPMKPDVLLGIESRGFLVAAPVAAALGIGFVMARKKGKLPGRTVAHDYALEYRAHDTIEIQEDLLKRNQRVVICDDLLATGGTAAAATTLAKNVGADVIHAAFIIELAFLNGRQKLDIPTTALISYDA